jgi:predicted Zn-dependent protease
VRKFRKILRYFLLITLGFAIFSFSECHAESLLLKLEKEIGFTAYRELIREKQVVRLTPEAGRRIQEIFKKLVLHAKRQRELTFSLTVLADPEVNAYALPGGYIFVNTGLLEFTAEPGEIAAVLAHEIGHVDCKHGINAISRTIGLTIALQLLAARTENPDRLTQLGSVAIGLAQKGYSRNAEYQADQAGARLLEKAGYSSRDLVRFFHKLAQESDSAAGSFFLWKLIDTHPPFPERIKRIEQKD